MSAKTVLAIDPGSSKCGLAVVARDANSRLSLLWRRIEPRETVGQAICDALAEHAFSLIIIGAGTKSKEVIHEIRERLPGMGILVVDERDTTLNARERYWEHNPRRGWRRLVPATLQVPPEPVDDFVALILAERVLQQS